MNENLPRLLRISEVAEILQVSKTTVYRLAQEGDLPAVRFAGGTVRVRAEDLEKYIEDLFSELDHGLFSLMFSVVQSFRRVSWRIEWPFASPPGTFGVSRTVPW